MNSSSSLLSSPITSQVRQSQKATAVTLKYQTPPHLPLPRLPLFRLPSVKNAPALSLLAKLDYMSSDSISDVDPIPRSPSRTPTRQPTSPQQDFVFSDVLYTEDMENVEIPDPWSFFARQMGLELPPADVSHSAMPCCEDQCPDAPLTEHAGADFRLHLSNSSFKLHMSRSPSTHAPSEVNEAHAIPTWQDDDSSLTTDPVQGEDISDVASPMSSTSAHGTIAASIRSVSTSLTNDPDRGRSVSFSPSLLAQPDTESRSSLLPVSTIEFAASPARVLEADFHSHLSPLDPPHDEEIREDADLALLLDGLDDYVLDEQHLRQDDLLEDIDSLLEGMPWLQAQVTHRDVRGQSASPAPAIRQLSPIITARIEEVETADEDLMEPATRRPAYSPRTRASEAEELRNFECEPAMDKAVAKPKLVLGSSSAKSFFRSSPSMVASNGQLLGPSLFSQADDEE